MRTRIACRQTHGAYGLVFRAPKKRGKTKKDEDVERKNAPWAACLESENEHGKGAERQRRESDAEQRATNARRENKGKEERNESLSKEKRRKIEAEKSAQSTSPLARMHTGPPTTAAKENSNGENGKKKNVARNQKEGTRSEKRHSPPPRPSKLSFTLPPPAPFQVPSSVSVSISVGRGGGTGG
ncbi:hypothetical protein C8R45DRAFT_1037870 [Mycena sanguinolenta]|nr:hypothetical protein C8R45DRAFT_1037870 [Mycena sanguinolenta]